MVKVKSEYSEEKKKKKNQVMGNSQIISLEWLLEWHRQQKVADKQLTNLLNALTKQLERFAKIMLNIYTNCWVLVKS